MRLSVIVPTLNEEAELPGTLAALRMQGAHEIIVADGGSTDATPRLAGAADQFVTGARGRAAQMNLGAARATGDAFLFLHADCRPEPGGLAEAVKILARGRVAAGCFRMQVAAPGGTFRLIDGWATARVWLTGLVYGDQGLFLRREVFERVGGFPAVRFMEDVLISTRLRRLGRVVAARSRLLVSPRRWQRVGVVRQTLRNWGLTALAAAGMHPDRLARFYPVVRSSLI